MNRLLSLLLVINRKSVVISALAVLSTWASIKYGFVADFPLTLISTAVVFPIVFSIGHAYKRRENALDEYGGIKAHGRAIYFAARDWIPEESDARLRHVQRVLADLLHGCRDMFKSPLSEMPKHEAHVYAAFSNLSAFVKRMREEGLASGECSRCNQYLSKMIISFENIKHIYQYRTPRTLRAFSDFFIVLLPILYGPYFAHEAAEYAPGLIYVTPVLFALILVGLDNIQHHLEDPFDQIGEDDVAINAEKFIDLLSCGEEASAPASVCAGAGRLTA